MKFATLGVGLGIIISPMATLLIIVLTFSLGSYAATKAGTFVMP